MRHLHQLQATAVALCASLTMAAQTSTLTVNVKKTGAPIPSTMYGLFFEDINYAADGGLYGELVKNRSFEFPQPLMGWQSFGQVTVESDGPFERCPHYVTLSAPGHHERRTGLVNEGYFGIGVIKGEQYRFSVWAKAPEGKAQIKVQLIDESTLEERQDFIGTELDITSSQWKRYEVVMTSPKTDNKARLRIFLKGSSPVSLEHVSLFPVGTFRNRRNGMRRDLGEALADLRPGVFRFPGGCIVEGEELAHRYQWKNTIGPVENRPVNRNRWEFTFEHRYYPDYFQSGGLGFFEYFQLAEDIGAEPLPVLNVGMACQYQNAADAAAHQPVDRLEPYIQDALDLIEFANGDTATTWGRQRAEMGHSAPFRLKFIAIGNEQWDSLYYERLQPFVKAIRKRYPDIRIVGSSGPAPDDKRFENGWAEMRRLKADLVDEHFYRDEAWFLSHGLRYENYDRRGPKVFAGEYACHAKGKKWNHFGASLCEAAFMTDLERNADVVQMATYAPLFAHVDGWQWRPDLIWYDNTKMLKTASYHVQQMYARHKGTHMLALSMNGQPVAGLPGQHGLYASAVADKAAGTVIVKVVNTGESAQPVCISLQGMKQSAAVQTLTLSSDDMDADNTLDNPTRIEPQEGKASTVAGKSGATLSDALPAHSLRIYIIPCAAR